MKEKILEILNSITDDDGYRILKPSMMERKAKELNALFEKKLKDELINYDKYMSSNYFGNSVFTPKQAVNEYLKSLKP